MPVPRKLLVLYDADCPLCARCRHWLEHEDTYVPIEFMAAGSEEARRAFADPLPWLGQELVVVSDGGQAWVGPAAFLTCLWATRRYREWAHRMSGPAFAPLAERFFHAISTRRRSIARVIGGPHDDCLDGRCKHRARTVA